MRHVDCECEFPHATPEGCARQKHLAENIRHSLDQTVLRTAYERAVERFVEHVDETIMNDLPEKLVSSSPFAELAKLAAESGIVCVHCGHKSGEHHAPECPLWSMGRVPTPPTATNGVKDPTMHIVSYVEERTFGVTPGKDDTPPARRRRMKLTREKPRTPVDRESFVIALRYHFDALFDLIDRAKAEARITSTIRWDYDESRPRLDLQQEL